MNGIDIEKVMSGLGMERWTEKRHEYDLLGYIVEMTPGERNRFEEWFAAQQIAEEWYFVGFRLRTMVARGVFDRTLVSAAFTIRNRCFDVAKEWCRENLPQRENP